MGDGGGEESGHWSGKGSVAHEEKILVSVRLRPLNAKERSRQNVSDWECINDNTIVYKSTLNAHERSMFPTAYTFDRVFGHDCSTKQVYEEGAKKVALSVVDGINSSIFAYGQTSSGKTYTMSGITENAVADIYDHIERHREREFKLKFSAMEIYNEALRDLLSTDSAPLRLLDDPERGTVVEKLTEETLRDRNHLQELLSICESQRQIGETALNETSSRSHQILRLTIESSARKFVGAENSSSLAASVSFVDLAGSERASQTSTDGARLKEGCHINRSLLTLGTVIRKLSKGRNGHIPYRDSKLTRILQNSLGGNARTAIICTLSPAHIHIEQSRNTLLFASCAKEVSTNAQVNVVMSDKTLVKHLQRELARLESELRSLGSNPAAVDSTVLLKEKELLIEKMDKEIKDLTQQRDLAQSQIDDLLRSFGEDRASTLSIESDQVPERQVRIAWTDEYSASESSEVTNPYCLDLDLTACNTSHCLGSCKDLNSKEHFPLIPENSENMFLLDGAYPRLSICSPEFVGQDPDQDWDINPKVICEDPCVEMRKSSVNSNTEDDTLAPRPEEKEGKIALTVAGDTDEISFPRKEYKDLCHSDKDYTNGHLEQKVQDMKKTIEHLLSLHLLEQFSGSTEANRPSFRSSKLNRSRSCGAAMITVPSSPLFDEAENGESTLRNGLEKDFPRRSEGFLPKLAELKYGDGLKNVFRQDSQTSDGSISMDEKAQNIKTSEEGDTNNAHNFVETSNEIVEVVPAMQLGDEMVTEKTAEDTMQSDLKSPTHWSPEFERQQREIIALWDACNVPLVHRTYFFLLFKGNPSDSVYMEVELRRLTFLKETFSHGSATVKDGQPYTLASSKRALNREREMLGRQVPKRFSTKEIETIYQKWGIGLDTKQRKLQLVRRIWSDTKDMDHIKESAALVAKLVGFIAPSQAPQEIFGLSFLPKPLNRRSCSWKHMSSIS